MTTADPRSTGTRPLWAKVAAIAVLLILAWLAWRAVGMGLADHFAGTDPARALAWRADHPEALLRQAERLARDPAQAAEAGAHARRALAGSPLDGRAYRVLGQLADAEGDRERAAGLFTQAVALAPLDMPSQVWLLDYHLDRRAARPALEHLDAMLRMNPNLIGPMLPVLAGLAATPEAQDPMAELLAGSPPWRSRALVRISQGAEDPLAVAPLFERLRKAPGGLAPPELAAWLDRLVAEGQWGPAYLTWVSQLPPERQLNIGNVFNGGFEWEPAGGGFDWRIGRIRGARIARMAGDGVTGRFGLRVAFEDQRVRFNHLSQLLVLPPGLYRLQLRARPDNLRTERGLVWTVSCAEGGAVLGETAPLRGSGAWRDLEMDFEVPVNGCEGQRLALRLPARIPAEQRIGGRVWFDDVVIARRQDGPRD
jgi:tetratricopeptide (TPR) repeat protein